MHCAVLVRTDGAAYPAAVGSLRRGSMKPSSPRSRESAQLDRDKQRCPILHENLGIGNPKMAGGAIGESPTPGLVHPRQSAEIADFGLGRSHFDDRSVSPHSLPRRGGHSCPPVKTRHAQRERTRIHAPAACRCSSFPCGEERERTPYQHNQYYLPSQCRRACCNTADSAAKRPRLGDTSLLIGRVYRGLGIDIDGLDFRRRQNRH